MKTCILICNLESGKGIKENELQNIIKTIEKHNYEVTLKITEKSGDAKEYVKNIKSADLVLSIGGDGTFNEIISGNYQRKKRLLLSHIPVGTTNDIGNMLGLGKNIIKNIDNILNGEIKQVDIGLINKQPFMYVAGFGKFINVPYETSRNLKKKFGHFAYIINGIKEFFNKTKLYELEYTIENTTYRGLYTLILISNANRIAGFNNIYKNVKLDDSKFEIMFCNITKKQTLVKSILIMLKSDITNVPGIYCHTTDNLTIKFKEAPKLNWTIDGERLDSDKKEFKIEIDKETYMLIPKKNINNLFIKK